MELQMSNLKRLRRTVRVSHPLPVLLLVIAQYGDVATTWAVLHVGGYEFNPLSAWVLHFGGFAALLLFKSFCALCCVVAIALCEWGWPEHPMLGADVAILGSLPLLILIFWNTHTVMQHVTHLAHLG